MSHSENFHILFKKLICFAADKIFDGNALSDCSYPASMLDFARNVPESTFVVTFLFLQRLRNVSYRKLHFKTWATTFKTASLIALKFCEDPGMHKRPSDYDISITQESSLLEKLGYVEYIYINDARYKLHVTLEDYQAFVSMVLGLPLSVLFLTEGSSGLAV
eukprot:Platyproteum_vivax@DN7339_c0_g1_i1.p1